MSNSTPTHRERLQACLNGKILDRPPVALWRHFPVDDQTPEGLAAATLLFQRTYDFDLVKVTPASSFFVKDWGVEDAWQGDAEGTRGYTKRVIRDASDWERLPVLDPIAPHLADQLTSLRLLRQELGKDVPIIQTIFSPLAQAKNLAGGETLIMHLRESPKPVMQGLEIITETTRRFIEAASHTGIDGIFYAVQHAQANLLSKDEFRLFSKTYDLAILENVQDLWCNMVHIHGKDIYFNQVAGYPVQILNWHDRETAPSLREAQKSFNGVICGGLSLETLVLGRPAEIRKEAAEANQQTKGQRFILGTGCVIPTITPHGNILTARQCVEESA
jgi:uroporphyrinogen decarboxylase